MTMAPGLRKFTFSGHIASSAAGSARWQASWLSLSWGSPRCVGLRGGQGPDENGGSYRQVRSNGEDTPSKEIKLTIASCARS